MTVVGAYKFLNRKDTGFFSATILVVLSMTPKGSKIYRQIAMQFYHEIMQPTLHLLQQKLLNHQRKLCWRIALK